MTDSPTFWLVVAIAALIVAVWLGLQIVGFLLKLLVFVAAVVLAVAAFRAWEGARHG